MAGFTVERKAPSHRKKIFEKKFFQLICADKIFKTVSGICFKIIESRDIKLLVILQFQKIVFLKKIINKTRTTKNQDNFAQRFGAKGNCS